MHTFSASFILTSRIKLGDSSSDRSGIVIKAAEACSNNYTMIPTSSLTIVVAFI